MPKRTKRILKYCDLPVVFATASPRRRELINKIKYLKEYAPDLTRAGERLPIVRPVFMNADVEEVKSGALCDVASENARLKGEWAAKRTEHPVFSFDTVVGLCDAVYGKPQSRDEAIFMLKSLCGVTHEVVTAVYFAVKGKIIQKFQKTSVTFGAFDRELVYNYVDSGAPYDKAGGYNIDDAAIAPLIKSVCGESDNVVGLPIALTEKLIEEYLIYGEDGYSH